jgi:hypothetical protein
MHRHFTALRRASLSSGVVIQESERGSPWADSIAVMRDCAGQILKELEPDESLLSKQSASLQSFVTTFPYTASGWPSISTI